MEAWDQLHKLPCWYCKYYYSYSSRCANRQTQHHSELESCPMMEIDDNQVSHLVEDLKLCNTYSINS